MIKVVKKLDVVIWTWLICSSSVMIQIKLVIDVQVDKFVWKHWNSCQMVHFYQKIESTSWQPFFLVAMPTTTRKLG